jgi:superfamily II DNA or RNA helicase
MCESAASRGKRVLVLAHRKELAEQHRQLFSDFGLDTDNIRVALFWSEVNRLGEYDAPDLIIADETHWIPNTMRKVLDYYDCRVIGLTATPTRLTGDPLGAVYEEMIVGVSVKELIERKRLAPYDYYSVPVADVSDLSIRNGDYVVGESEELLMKPAIYGNVIDAYKKFADGKKTLVYCTSIKHSKSVAEAFVNAGYRAVHMDSNTPKQERDRIMADFRSGAVQVLCNVLLIVEGISVPDCECCILLRPTLSTTIYIQSAMRCMRYAEGKRAVIIDMVMNYLQLGLPDEDRVWSLGEPLKRKPRTDGNGDFYIRSCPECFMTFKTAPICPFCNTPYKLTEREIKAHEDIELQRISVEEARKAEEKRKELRREQGRAQTFEELVKLAKDRGYKNPAYYAHKVMRGRRK